MQNNQDEIKEFFSNWDIYKKIIKFNYMSHNEIFSFLHGFLSSDFHAPLVILDIGCGDATLMARALKNQSVSYYCGIDISEVALTYAEENMRDISGEKVFLLGDFKDIIGGLQVKFNIIVAGYSVHHLRLEEKELFFSHCRSVLKPEGWLLSYDVVCNDNELSEDYLKRQWKIYQNWTEITPKELSLVHEHIFTSDYPESLNVLEKLAKRGGFKQSELVFRDKNQLFAFHRFWGL